MELENKKEDIFQLSNIHFQTEYFRLEAEKWETYVVAATNKKQTSIEERVEAMETIIEESHSLPIARPSSTGLADPPAPLDLSDFAEIFDEWLPEPVPKKKKTRASTR